jgi:hypothetical protein
MTPSPAYEELDDVELDEELDDVDDDEEAALDEA